MWVPTHRAQKQHPVVSRKPALDRQPRPRPQPDGAQREPYQRYLHRVRHVRDRGGGGLHDPNVIKQRQNSKLTVKPVNNPAKFSQHHGSWAQRVVPGSCYTRPRAPRTVRVLLTAGASLTEQPPMGAWLLVALGLRGVRRWNSCVGDWSRGASWMGAVY